jgi:heptose I phosphotransferase
MRSQQEVFARAWRGQDVFQAADRLEGEVTRAVPGRSTRRFRFEGADYYIKRHYGVGWREIFKNLAYLRLPVLGASNELQAILRLQSADIATLTVAAYAERGRNPARRESFIVTRALTDTVSLEDLCRGWAGRPPSFGVKRALLERVADVARRLHGAGVNHRDFYICHFLLARAWLRDPRGLPPLYLIDLHRAQIRPKVPRRWRLKDVAGLFYSALGAGLTRNDLLRFMRIYSGGPLRQTLAADARFWRAVARKGAAMYLEDGHLLPAGLRPWLEAAMERGR